VKLASVGDVRNSMGPTFLNTKSACAGIAMCLASVSFGQSANVVNDTRLKTPISVKLKIVQLPDALKQLTKLGGVKLTNVQTINDLKVTVFVKDLPEGVLLDKIAGVLGCEWKADGDLLRLVVDPEERIRRDRYIDAEDAAARKEVESELDRMARAGSTNPTATDDVHVGSVSPAGTGNPRDAALASFLSGLDGGRVSALWRGDVVAGSMPPSEAAGVDANSSGLSASGGFNQNRRRPRPALGAPIFMQYDPLLYQVQISSGASVRTVAKRPAHLITDYAPSGALANMPFAKEVLGWDQAVPAEGDLTKVSIAATDKISANAGHRLSIADYLEVAFDQTQVPIVADGFRTPTLSKELNHGVGPMTSWLATLKQENHFFTRFEDGVVMVRHGGFWRLRKFETPEEVLAPFEQKASKEKLSLDDYASLVLKLTPEQLKPFSTANQSVVRFDPHPIEVALPALQFYGSLDSRSIGRAMENGVSCNQLGSTQRSLFNQAAFEGVFLGAASAGFKQDLVRLYNTGDERGLGFVMRKGVPAGGSAAAGQAMLFGASISEASTYLIPVSQ